MQRTTGQRDPNRPDMLTQKFVDSVKVPGRFGDRRGGHGLSLLVTPDSIGGVSKAWSQRMLWADTQVTIGLGSARHVSLADARDRAGRNYFAMKDGKDPRRHKRPTGTTFAQVTERAITNLRPRWKPGTDTEKQMRTLMGRYVLPHIGRMAVDAITTGDLVDFLEPLTLDKPAIAHKLKGYLSQVFKYSIQLGLRESNPAGENLSLVRVKERHFTALRHAQVGAAVAAMRDSDKWEAPAVEYLILTAARSGEVRGADWSEIDLGKATWSIPAFRMEASREHRIPLSDRAIEILKARPGRTGLIFPAQKGKFAQPSTFRTMLVELGIKSTIHGSRSSFRDWCAEQNVDRQLAETALAHSVGDATEIAYFRSDLFELRRELMHRWSDYLGY